MHPDVAPSGTNANEDTCTTDAQPTPTAILAERRILLCASASWDSRSACRRVVLQGFLRSCPACCKLQVVSHSARIDAEACVVTVLLILSHFFFSLFVGGEESAFFTPHKVPVVCPYASMFFSDGEGP